MKTLAMIAAAALTSTALANYTADWSGGADGWDASQYNGNATGWTLTGGTWFAADLSGNGAGSSEWLISPLLTVDEAAVVFGFDHYYDMETNYDGGVVEYQVNGGAWTYLSMSDYDATISTSFQSPIGGLDAYTGFNAGRFSSADISSLVTMGDTLMLRFHQADDSSVSADGWYIESFGIEGASIPAPGALALLGLAGLARRRRR
jgi:MYXO-CTERM domain-containing protein